jgi:hypothetical protein
MRAPDRYSVSPLHSFCTVTTRRAPSLSEMVRQIIAWLRGRKPTFREQVLDAQLVERLAEEIAEEETPRPGAPAPPKRPIRT